MNPTTIIAESRETKVETSALSLPSVLALFFLIFATPSLHGQKPTQPAEDWKLIEAENRVELIRAGAADWNAVQTNAVVKIHDRLRTGFKSRATLRLSNQGLLRVNQLTTLEVQPPPPDTKEKSVLNLESGVTYFFNREAPVETEFRTPQASGAIRGTEFNLEVNAAGSTIVTLLDGAVTLSNALGQVSLGSGEQGIADPGQAPRKTAVLNAINIIQWDLYYPGFLDLKDSPLSAVEQAALAGSVTAYQNGNLLLAISQYPAGRVPASGPERVFYAALQLAVGQVQETEAVLAQANNGIPSATDRAFRELLAAVKFQTVSTSAVPATASEWMARSYYFQSRSDLPSALAAARKAAELSPQFGFAWSRLAELEFGFGRIDIAMGDVNRSLELSRENAEALSLKGFLLAAQNKVGDASLLFERAIAIDGALGNAWLGRGLVRIRQGRAAEGRQDLQAAATLEPQRAVLRSYLGKAFSNEGDARRAQKELDLAKRYDTNDPTAFLYSALLNGQENRINESVRDLEKSQELNDNRSVFRSKLLLDQDRAVRGANLAAVYRDAGMYDQSVREASRAVNYDYANASAHLFLADSYDYLRDPRQITLRYDTPWQSELLLADLLSPVGAGSLSQNVSQQEYSKLFEQDHLGISSSTEYFSHGAWQERSSQFGTYRDVAYATDVEYRTDPGYHANEDVTALTWSTQAKVQLTPHDTFFLQGLYFDYSAGDAAQYYNQQDRSLTQRVKESQEPTIYAGYHHEWAPGVHTLVLGARFQDTFLRTDPGSSVLYITRNPAGQVTGAALFPLGGTAPFSLDYRSELEGYSGEIQQIFETEKHALVFGSRYQNGSADTALTLQRAPSFPPIFSSPVADQSVQSTLHRFNIYAYEQFQLLPSLRLIGGVSYDQLTYPKNIDIAPITADQGSKSQVSPKGGFIWNPEKDTFIRGYYAQSLGGVYFDSSLRLEPSQVAGFAQSYRSLIPESVQGLVPGTRFETYGLGIDHHFKTGTYLGAEAEWLGSSGDQTFGVFENIPAVSGSTPIQLNYRERSLVFTLDQLVGKEFSLGARFKWSPVDLQRNFTEFLPSAGSAGYSDQHATQQTLNLYANYYLPCGFFAQAQSVWASQSNRGYVNNIPGDDFWQHNLFVGYRFPHRHAELRLGVLNIFDQDYNLNPLNLFDPYPRERTFYVQFKFAF